MLSLWHDSDSELQVTRLGWPSNRVNDADYIAQLVNLFKDVAEEEGWEPGDAIERELDHSVYFTLNARGQLVGGLQLTLPDKQGELPCFEVWPEAVELVRFAARKHSVAHISILALANPFRGQAIHFWRLAVEMWRYCVSARITSLLIEVTPRVLPLYRRLGWPLVICGDLRCHWGEDCYLCSLSVVEVAEVLLRRAGHSPFYQQIVAQAFRIAFGATEETISSVVHETPAPYSYTPDYAVAA